MRICLVILARLNLQCRFCVHNRLIHVPTPNLSNYQYLPLCYRLNNTSMSEIMLRLSYSTNRNTSNKKGNDLENPKPDQTKKKKEIKVFVTLVGSKGEFISITTVEEATKLASRRNMRLIKVMDYEQKTGRPVYKMMSESEYLKGDGWTDSKSKKEKEKTIKGDKVVSLSSSTAEHDILIKVKMMQKWLDKKFEVRVVVTGDLNKGEAVFKIIEKEIGSNGRIVQKRTKGQDIRFQILPPKKTETPKKMQQTEEVEGTEAIKNES